MTGGTPKQRWDALDRFIRNPTPQIVKLLNEPDPVLRGIMAIHRAAGVRIDQKTRDAMKDAPHQLVITPLEAGPGPGLAPTQAKELERVKHKPYIKKWKDVMQESSRRAAVVSPEGLERLRRDLAERIRSRAKGEDGLRLCGRCGIFFIPTNRRKWRFCSRRCARDWCAAKYTKIRRTQEHARKLSRARAASKLWEGPEDWKAWVACRAKITRNFISYAVARGELKAPKSAGAENPS